MPALRLSNTAKRATLAAALLGVLGLATGLALASAAPPAPRITVHPPARTRSRLATIFRFTDSQPNVRFSCSVNGGLYAPCSSPRIVAVSRVGRNVFRVRASAAGNLSAPAIYAWTVDLKAPRITVTFPVEHRSYDPVTWRGVCAAGIGVCGTVRAPSGLKSVIVWIRQDATNRYWNGHSYTGGRATFRPAVISPRPTPGRRLTQAHWFYPMPLPKTGGEYTVRVRASDLIGNITRLHTQQTIAFDISTAAPPTPTISSGPSNPTSSSVATFSLADAWAGVTFECSIDGQPWMRCAPSITYGGLEPGTHVFWARALDSAGNVSQIASYTWTIAADARGVQFTITGDASGPLYPGGAARLIALTVINPNGVPIYVTSLTAAVAASSLPTGCSASGYRVAQPSIPGSGVAVPANGSVTLPAQGATTATVAMLDLPSDQDACRGARLSLTYSGSAHS